MLPAQALGPEWMREEHFAGIGGMHVPVLVGVVEADVRGPDDLKSPERTEIDHIGVEAANVAARVEAEGGVHPSPPSCCWLL